MSTTLFEKIWAKHVVTEEAGFPSVLYIDLHLIHEVTSPQAFSGLEKKNLSVRCPERTVATMDHSVPTLPSHQIQEDKEATRQLNTLRENCEAQGIRLFDVGSENQGIVHVIGPELGFTQPGMTIVCGDSHTATHGAFGSLAFGIGTSQVEHVLATQCLLQRRPKTMAVNIVGELPTNATAKDVILALIAKIGVGGGTGHVIEYRGPAIKAMNMDERMTICNMSIEAGARAGMIAPDETTFSFLAGKQQAPTGKAWESALDEWRQLQSDPNAVFDTEVELDVSAITPWVTYGTNPAMGIPIKVTIPKQGEMSEQAGSAHKKALAYMGLEGGKPLSGHPVDVVFIGSCTNSRLSDLRAAADVMRGRQVKPGVRTLVVPGSNRIKKAAEAEGLDKVFLAAGAEWRLPGCSMCIAMNGDQLAPGQYAVSTSNRNFEGRQGKGSRTFLASPATAAASAIAGAICDAGDLTKTEAK